MASVWSQWRRLGGRATAGLLSVVGAAALVLAGSAPAKAGTAPGEVRTQANFNWTCESNELCLYRLAGYAGGVNDTAQYNSSYYDTTGAADRFSTGYPLNDRVSSYRNRDLRYYAAAGEHTRPNYASGDAMYIRPGESRSNLQTLEDNTGWNLNDSWSSHCWFDSVNSCGAWGVPRPS